MLREMEDMARGWRRSVARIDYEYKRNGTANLFMLSAPVQG
jgi:hypothetical protein